LEAAAKNSRRTLLLQIALYLRDVQGTERSMGAAMLLEHLDFSTQEIDDSIRPYLETDDPKLRRVFDDLMVEHEDPGPIEQSRFLIEEGKLDQAEELLKRSLRDPELEAEARSEEIGYLIHASGIARGDADKARERIAELEKLDWREAMLQRAELFSKEENAEGQFVLLLEYLEQLTEIPSEGLPQKSHAYWRLGMAYEQLRRTDDARGAYEQAIQFDSDNKEARAALKKLPRG
jgi:Flp pilus assembly protein TadD